MSGKHSRTKGAGGERELAKLLGLDRAARNGKAAGDLSCPEGYPFSIEVKRRSKAYTHLYKCIEQAEGYGPNRIDAAGVTPLAPLAIVRDDHASWLVVLRLSDAVELIPGLRVKESK